MPGKVDPANDRVRRFTESHVLVMSFPNGRWWTRLGLTFVNLGFRVMRMQFRVFMHPPELILVAAEKHGFTRSLNHRGLVWQVAALERTA